MSDRSNRLAHNSLLVPNSTQNPSQATSPIKNAEQHFLSPYLTARPKGFASAFGGMHAFTLEEMAIGNAELTC